MAVRNLIPYAVSLLVIRDDLKLLAVSRKDDPNSFGLPGGKVDPGELPRRAVVREVKEETGLDIWRAVHVFSGICEGDTRYFNINYIATSISGLPKQQPGEGRVAWIPYQLLFFGAFGEYNHRLMTHLGLEKQDLASFFRTGRNFARADLLANIEVCE